MCKKSLFYKTISIFLFSIFLAFSPLQAPRADAWLAIKATLLNRFMAAMADQIKGVILGAMKTAATTVLTEAVSDFVGGSDPQGSKIISNYQDFIFTQPQAKAELYLNDLLSQTTGGQNSSSYVSNEGIGDYASPASGGAAYKTQLANSAKANITAQKNILQPTYVGNPGQNMFAEGNLDNFNSYLSGINNPWAYNLYVQQKYQEKLEQEEEAARMEALTGMGYKSQKQDGQIITPGSTIGTTMSNVLDIGNKTLANASNPGEVITAVVQQIIMQALQNGIGKAQENNQPIQRNVQNSSQAQTQVGGPGAQYGNPSSTPAQPWVNPDNKPAKLNL